MNRPLSAVELAILEDAKDIVLKWEELIFLLDHGPEVAAEVEAENELDFADTLTPAELS